MKQFNKVADAYSKNRPGYPDALYTKLLQLNGGRRFARVADVGCGSGQSSYGLLRIADSVIGVEPGASLRKLAAERYPSIRFKKGSGENTGIEDSSLDLVTVATAFYWMDMPRALLEFSRILKPGGILSIYRYGFPHLNSSGGDVVMRHMNENWDYYRDPVLKVSDPSHREIQTSNLFVESGCEVLENRVLLDVEDYVGFLSSTSYVSKYMETLDAPSSYAARLSQEIADTVGSRVLEANFDITFVWAIKPEMRSRPPSSQHLRN